MISNRSTRTGLLAALVAAAAAVGLSACSLVGNGSTESSKDVVLVTHDSFVLPKALIAQFDRQSGYHLVVHAAGDGGTLTNKLVLTQGDPTGDVAFGVDNTFASRALDAGVFAPYDVSLPPGAGRYLIPGDDHRLAPVDNGNVCVNVDTTWFRAHHLTPPRSLGDLTKPAYHGPARRPRRHDQLHRPGLPARHDRPVRRPVAVVLDRAAGQRRDHHRRLVAGLRDRLHPGRRPRPLPIVVSYDSSPAFTVPKGADVSTTKALLDTCFRQVEYAGVLAGAQNVQGAEAFVDFLLSPAVQKALPDAMYVFPVRSRHPAAHGLGEVRRTAAHPFTVSPARISAHRDSWLRQWSDIISR